MGQALAADRADSLEIDAPLRKLRIDPGPVGAYIRHAASAQQTGQDRS